MTAYCETPEKCKNLSIGNKDTLNEYGWCKKIPKKDKRPSTIHSIKQMHT